jgi:uncharacterized protein HemX
MKKIFVKESQTALWIGAAVVGALAAGAGIWFYLRGKRAAEEEAYRREHAQDYLKGKSKKKKKQKTAPHELEGIVNHHPDETH